MSVGWVWVALRPAVEGASAWQVEVLAPESGAMRLLGWPAGKRPHDDAVRVDAAVLDPSGAPAVVVWQEFPDGAAPLFDAPAVQQLTRRLAEPDLGGRRPDAVSTFTRDPVHYAGGLTVHRDGRPVADLLRDSWLRRLGPVTALHVPAGVVGRTSLPTGRGTQRYAGAPWPVGGFGDADA